MTHTPGRRVGRPSTSVLDRERILKAALDLLNSTGPEKFTMSALAADLGVKTPALYHYVKNKAALLIGMREHISNRIDTSGFHGKPWDEAVVQWARSYRSAFAAHPNVIALLATEPIAGAHRTLAMYEEVVQGFLAAGWRPDKVMNHVVVLESFILGSSLDAVAPAGIYDPGDDGQELPGLREALRCRVVDKGGPASTAFEEGLAVLVQGLQAVKVK